MDCGDIRVSEIVWAESGPGEGDDVQLALVDGDIDRWFGLPGLELPDVPEMVTVTVTSQNVSWTDECVVAGFDVAVVGFFCRIVVHWITLLGCRSWMVLR